MRPIEIAIAVIVYVAVLGAAYAYPNYRASSSAAARAEAVQKCRATIGEYREIQRRREGIPNGVVEDAFRCEREVLTSR